MDGNTEYVITKLHGESDRSLGGQYPGMDWLHFEIERGQKKRCSSQGRSSASHLSQFVSSIRTCERWNSNSVEGSSFSYIVRSQPIGTSYVRGFFQPVTDPAERGLLLLVEVVV